jgi:uncharacterized protein YkwD
MVMFRKTLKTLKIFLIIAIVIVCLPHSILPHQTSGIEKIDFDNYLKLNKSELRLIEFKDNDEALKIKLIQLKIINKSRKSYKAGPIKLDILASRIANKMCREAAENNFIGHWNMAGEKPYNNSNISSMMKSTHEKFMYEKSPDDRHKKTIIDKSYNFVGIGYYLSGKQFRYHEEFINSKEGLPLQTDYK